MENQQRAVGLTAGPSSCFVAPPPGIFISNLQLPAHHRSQAVPAYQQHQQAGSNAMDVDSDAALPSKASGDLSAKVCTPPRLDAMGDLDAQLLRLASPAARSAKRGLSFR